jgi:hypothetical protein
VSLGDHGAGRWIAGLYQGSGHKPIEAAARAQEPTLAGYEGYVAKDESSSYEGEPTRRC